MFVEAFRALIVAEHLLDCSISLLISFSSDIVQPIRSIHLPFTIGTCPYTTTITTNFLVVDCPMTYNVIFGRTCINDLKAMVSTHMLLMKFPTSYGNGYIRGDQLSARSCYNISVKQQHLFVPKETFSIHDQQAQLAEELEKVSISKDYPDRIDMLGISPDIICHRLSIDPKTKPVRQKRRSYDAERYEAMKVKVEKLKGIGFIRKVNYPTWVANVVLVKKNPTKERCELLSFMDAYSGYNQILMNPPDQEHTAFTTDRGLYCYKVMPSGLKNAGTTYQRLVNSMFAEQIGKNMEVYVDNMLVNNKHADQHIANLSETFTILKRYRMRLNPNKCAFSVGFGKSLSFMISQQDIETNPENIKAILDMKEPVTSKDIQSLTGKVAALIRFIYKATDRCAPFFKALKGSKKYITWTDEYAEAFKNLKDYMSKAHLLSKPEGCGARLVLTTPDKVAMDYALRFKFKASNNEAEYEALLAGLRLAKHLEVKRIDIFSDSQLVVNQVTNNFDAKDSSMAIYLA
ncbi:hypothetical protein ACFX16_041084 [Malus domestica]